MPPEIEIWLDVHISPIIAKWIREDFGYEAKSSFILQLQNLDDSEIYNKAKNAGYVILISKDSDLPAIVNRLGSPPKIINILGGNAKNQILYAVIKKNLKRCIRLLTQFDLNSIDLYL